MVLILFMVVKLTSCSGRHSEPGQRGDRGWDGGQRLVRVLWPGHHQHRAVRHRERLQTQRRGAAFRHRHQHERLTDRQVINTHTHTPLLFLSDYVDFIAHQTHKGNSFVKTAILFEPHSCFLRL